MHNNHNPDLPRSAEIICFSHDWTGDPLSKTHLVRILSRHNKILWINALPNRAPTANSKDLKRAWKKLADFAKPIEEVEPNIFVLNPLAVPSYGNAMIRSFNQRFLIAQIKKAMKRLGMVSPVNLIFNPVAGLIAGKLRERSIIYYCVDEYTAFTGASKGLKEIEEDLFKKADAVVVSAQKLYDSKSVFNANTHMIPHGTDWSHFRRALDADLQVPDEIADLPRPIIGFHGLLADWVDFELIRQVAMRFSEGSVVLIGKTTVDAEQHIKVLDDVKNIHLLGRKPYSALPAYCKAFDVALNPFKINDLTLAANPLKVREYLAAGVPVVSTDIPEVRNLDGCRIGSTPDEFIENIAELLRLKLSREEISDTMRTEGWEARVEQLKIICPDLA